MTDSKPPCAVEDCDRTAFCRGWCGKHYKRWHSWGDPTYRATMGRPLFDVAPTTRRPVRSISCRMCGTTFQGRNGRLCRPCTYRNQGGTCECGAVIHPKAQMCRSCRSKKDGPANAHWKGGRFLRAGYVQLWCPEPHPRYKGRYVPEHTLVMERMLGRYLLSGESVHHRNGVRHDNRPENLELWVKSQPAGQRAVDLLAWARQIIATYEPVEPVIASPV